MRTISTSVAFPKTVPEYWRMKSSVEIGTLASTTPVAVTAALADGAGEGGDASSRASRRGHPRTSARRRSPRMGTAYPQFEGGHVELRGCAHALHAIAYSTGTLMFGACPTKSTKQARGLFQRAIRPRGPGCTPA